MTNKSVTGVRQRFGANIVVDTLVEHGVTTFFANPGTSEIHLVQAIDENPRARAVLCLFEGVATGAADGFARACGCPAAVLLHLGPGLANGLANMHNARKAHSPMIVIVGEHATGHLQYDTPLRSDVDTIAGYAAKAVFRLTPQSDIRQSLRDAVLTAQTAPSGPVVVLANADVMWSPVANERPETGFVTKPIQKAIASDGALFQSALDLAVEAAQMLQRGGGAALLLGSAVLSAHGLRMADQIAQATGCQLLCETFNARHERGAGIPAVERLPYFRETAVERLQGITDVVLIGSRPPVAFFESPEHRSELTPPGTTILHFPDECMPMAILSEIAKKLHVPPEARVIERAAINEVSGPLSPRTIWSVIARHLPEGAIVSDEAGVTSVGADTAMQGANPHIWMNLTGGSIGQGLPLAVGAAIAAPDRTVVAVHGDGGAMYTVQALWTQARELTHVVNVIFRNDRYAILQYETKRHGLGPLGPKGRGMFELSRPPILWTHLANSMGVEAVSVTTAEAFSEAFACALAAKGPRLIEVMLPAR